MDICSDVVRTGFSLCHLCPPSDVWMPIPSPICRPPALKACRLCVTCGWMIMSWRRFLLQRWALWWSSRLWPSPSTTSAPSPTEPSPPWAGCCCCESLSRSLLRCWQHLGRWSLLITTNTPTTGVTFCPSWRHLHHNQIQYVGQRSFDGLHDLKML